MTTFTDITTAAWDDIFGAVERCYELGWTDGLPVIPPTAERVAEFIGAVGHAPDDVIGELPRTSPRDYR